MWQGVLFILLFGGFFYLLFFFCRLFVFGFGFCWLVCFDCFVGLFWGLVCLVFCFWFVFLSGRVLQADLCCERLSITIPCLTSLI